LGLMGFGSVFGICPYADAIVSTVTTATQAPRNTVLPFFIMFFRAVAFVGGVYFDGFLVSIVSSGDPGVPNSVIRRTSEAHPPKRYGREVPRGVRWRMRDVADRDGTLTAKARVAFNRYR
jgi:hypothetical protein